MIKKISYIYIISFLISLCTLNCFSDEYNKKTLIIFSADWCKFCQKAKNDINSDKDLLNILKNYYVVNVDFDVDKDLVNGYNIKTIPTFVIIDGSKINKKVGYNGIKDFKNYLK